MNQSTHRVIATRRLSYKAKNNLTSRQFKICISEPFLLTAELVDFPYAEGAAGCIVSFDGFPEKEQTVVGGDTFQALELAVNSVESTLRRLNKKYHFYFEDDLYFDE